MKIVAEEEGDSATDEFGQADSTDAAKDIAYKITALKPIYEKLAPNEVFIISLQGDMILYVVNRLGRAHLEQATLEE